MLDNVECLCQSAIKIKCEKIIYFDPIKIENELHDADIIFVTHDHFDHFDVASINNIKKDNTTIVIPSSLVGKTMDLFSMDNMLVVGPEKEYEVDGIKFETVPAYNINKDFHPKSNNWVGYVVTIKDKKFYVMGDTDATPEAENVKCNYLFIPVGGTYTMTWEEAASLTNKIKPDVAIPIHYGFACGSRDDAVNFVKNIEVEGRIMINESN